MSNLDQQKQASTCTEDDIVYTPGTGEGQQHTITNIVVTPDTFRYGNIQVNDETINVHYSPFKHGWYKG